MENTYKFSVITINLNNAAGLEKTIKSVINQSFTDIQFIIIDGGSTDGSINIIERYKAKIHIYCSEKDSGVYEAMNKGIHRSSGEYCLFLNSGDFFVNDYILEAVKNINISADIISGDTLVYNNHKPEIIMAPEKVSFYTFYKHSIQHQSTFIRLGLFKEIGLYNEKFKIVGDWDFFIRALAKHKASYQTLSFLVTSIDAEGISSWPENSPICKKERDSVLNEYFEFFLPDYELVKDPTIYNFLLNIQNHTLLKSIFHFVFRVINRMLK